VRTWYIEIFSATKLACRVEVNHGLDLEVRLEKLVMSGACLSSNEERVALYEDKRESRDSAGLVIRGMTAHRRENHQC